MFIMKQRDESTRTTTMDISTTRLFSVHAYITKGIGAIKLSQSNFNIADRFELVKQQELNVANAGTKIAIFSIKDAPTKYFKLELISTDDTCEIELEVIFK